MTEFEPRKPMSEAQFWLRMQRAFAMLGFVMLACIGSAVAFGLWRLVTH